MKGRNLLTRMKRINTWESRNLLSCSIFGDKECISPVVYSFSISLILSQKHLMTGHTNQNEHAGRRVKCSTDTQTDTSLETWHALSHILNSISLLSITITHMMLVSEKPGRNNVNAWLLSASLILSFLLVVVAIPVLILSLSVQESG